MDVYIYIRIFTWIVVRALAARKTIHIRPRWWMWLNIDFVSGVCK